MKKKERETIETICHRIFNARAGVNGLEDSQYLVKQLQLVFSDVKEYEYALGYIHKLIKEEILDEDPHHID